MKAQDPEAWRRLVQLYGPMVYQWCRHCGLQAEDAADVGQEVFASVVRKVGQFQRDGQSGRFCAWLWTITRNEIRDLYRRRQVQPQAPGGTEAQRQFAQLPEAPPGTSPPCAGADDQVALVHRALASVRGRFEEQTWQAFWRLTMGQESGKDVADDLGMSPRAVYQAKHRILRAVREELGDLP